jgi:hypothetical protein
MFSKQSHCSVKSTIVVKRSSGQSNMRLLSSTDRSGTSTSEARLLEGKALALTSPSC